MEYINQASYDYIMNKYHDTTKPFEPLRRLYFRNDAIFEPDSGMAPDDLLTGIMENDKAYERLSHPVRKARAVEYVLQNTRIDCDPRDIFPAINALDRPLKKTIVQQWYNEIFLDTIPEINERRLQLERNGIVTIWPDYDHSVPVWDDLFELGLTGILERSERIRHSKPRNEEEDGFFEGIRATYEALLDFVERLRRFAEKIPGSEKLTAALGRLKQGAPAHFYDAMLLSYLYFIVSEHIDSLQVRSLGNFDRIYYDLYKNDLAQGISEEEIRRDLAHFLLQFTAIGNYWNQPVYLGGEKADGSTVINELSWLFLDVYDRMGILNPKIQIKVSDSTPKDFLLKALDMIRRGHNCIVLVSDASMRKALMNAGATADQARTADVKGCYEYSPASSYFASMNYLNMLKPMEYTLHKGCDGVTGVFSGTESPDLSCYETFEDLLAEYKNQLRTLIEVTRGVVEGFEGYLHIVNPLPLLSATYPSCLEKAKDALGGGGIFNGTTLNACFLADAADSLAMIQKYVYEKKEVTLPQLVEMLDKDFEGNEAFRLKLRADQEKYGNNMPRPDALAVELTDFMADHLHGKPNSPVRGGEWCLNIHAARMVYNHAPKTASSPNGRLKGEELSPNISPSRGQNRAGATAAILSATKLDTTAIISDYCLDLGLLPSAVSGTDGLEAMYGLLMTFVSRGGYALQINVFDAATLRDAQEHPGKYQDLQIRVAGWNVLWNNINKKEQDGFIRQAESLV